MCLKGKLRRLMQKVLFLYTMSTTSNDEAQFVRYPAEYPSAEELTQRSQQLFQKMNTRRSVRHFSEQSVPQAAMENIIRTASTAPSGAHKQPWTFCLVGNLELKRQIRRAVEKEEYESYHGRMPQDWLDDLAPLGTNWQKPYLDLAPWLVVVFRRIYEEEQGAKKQNYYVQESVGIATGFLLAAIHQAGLCALTHTPSPMGFLKDILQRPDNERPYLLIPVGHAAKDAQVPQLSRKPLSEIMVAYS